MTGELVRCNDRADALHGLPKAKIHGTILMLRGKWLGSARRIFLPGMMMGSSATVERNCWTMPATPRWLCHAVSCSNSLRRFCLSRTPPVRLSLCFRHKIAMAPARTRPPYMISTSSRPSTARRRRSCCPSSGEGYGSRMTGTTWCRRHLHGSRHHGLPLPGVIQGPIFTGLCGTSWLIGCEHGRKPGSWTRWFMCQTRKLPGLTLQPN